MNMVKNVACALAFATVLWSGVEPVNAVAGEAGGSGRLIYSDTGRDPKGEPRLISTDIRSSTRRVMQMSDHKVLVIRVRTYDTLNFWWLMQVGLDSRFGRKADFQIIMYNADMDGGMHCYLKHKAPRHREHVSKGRIVQNGDVARCRIRLSSVHPSKHPRWRVRPYSLNDIRRRHPDRAPTHGWYG